MAYGAKYKFKFENEHGIVYEIRLLEKDYSGSVTTRPLGSAPIIRMQQNGPFRSTSCDLTLECQVDNLGVGEFSFLYTSDPQQYKIVVYHGAILLWQGFVATEIYSEPDIAPPYDVKVTATDGLGVLKEYDFEPAGEQTIRAHLTTLLGRTGLSNGIYTVSSLKEHGRTPADFIDGVLIDLDYHDGDNCYDTLLDLLKTMRLTITQWGGEWLILRETDITVNSSGKVPGYFTPVDPNTQTYSLNIDGLTATVGQMGVAQMWPVGYLTRRVSPAKKSVKVIAPWHWKNGFAEVKDNGWNVQDDSSGGGNQNAYFVANGSYYNLGTPAMQIGTMRGKLWSDEALHRLMVDFKVTVRVSKNNAIPSNYPQGLSYLCITAVWDSGTPKYYTDRDGWDAGINDEGNQVSITATNPDHDIASTQEVSMVIPAPLDNNVGTLTIRIVGKLVEVYDIRVEPSTIKGYEDTILIDNGARGSADDLEIAGGRMTLTNFIRTTFYQGVFLWQNDRHVLTSYDDADNSELDYLSLTALNYAKVHAAARIEITGTIDFPVGRFEQPLLIQSHGSWALIESYDWNLKDAEINFKAVTLPTAVLSVDSETITSLPE